MNSSHYFSMVFIKNSTVQALTPHRATIVKRAVPQNRDGGGYAKPLVSLAENNTCKLPNIRN